MKYQPPRNWITGDTENPDGDYWNGDAAAALKGAIPPGKSIQAPQREIEHVIKKAGLVPSAADETQLYQAIAMLIEARIDEKLNEYGAVDGDDNPIGDANPVLVEAGSVQFIEAYDGDIDDTIALGRADPNRWVVIVQSGGEKMDPPVLAGEAMTEIIQIQNGVWTTEYLAIFAASIPAETTATLVTDTGSTAYRPARTAVYRMTGVTPESDIYSLATKAITVTSTVVYETASREGSGYTGGVVNSNPLTPSIEVQHPAGGGAVFVAFGSNTNSRLTQADIVGCRDELTVPSVETGSLPVNFGSGGFFSDYVKAAAIMGANNGLPGSAIYEAKTNLVLTHAVAIVFEYDATPTELAEG